MSDMRVLLQVLGVVVFGFILLIAGSVLYSTEKGYMKLYFRVNGDVLVDGGKTSGYMHASTDRAILLITRTDGTRPETYLVSLRSQSFISDCGKWHPVRFLPTAIEHVNPPCVFTDPAEVSDAPMPATLVRARKSVEFLTASGRRVKAEW